MANVNIGQDVANKRKITCMAGHIVSKYYSVKMSRYGSLINVNPSELSQVHIGKLFNFTIVSSNLLKTFVLFKGHLMCPVLKRVEDATYPK